MVLSEGQPDPATRRGIEAHYMGCEMQLDTLVIASSARDIPIEEWYIASSFDLAG